MLSFDAADVRSDRVASVRVVTVDKGQVGIFAVVGFFNGVRESASEFYENYVRKSGTSCFKFFFDSLCIHLT